jgi:methanogenic corrinoid protein MtbC1
MGSFPSSFLSGLHWTPRRSPARLVRREPVKAAQRTQDQIDADLVQMVESEIIPRLMMAHRSAAASDASLEDVKVALGEETVQIFAQMVVAKEPDSLIAYVGGLLKAGISMEAIYVDLLVPAARRLGDYWDDDTVSFTDVTIGLGRLQQVVRALGWKTPGHGENDRFSRSALFAPGPGEQHTFGLFIIEDFFRRSGWRTWIETAASVEDLAETARTHWFDVFGLSASTDRRIGELSRAVAAVRKASRNPNIYIMVGGVVFLEQPDLVRQVGADSTASSGGEAFLIVNEAILAAESDGGRLAAGA